MGKHGAPYFWQYVFTGEDCISAFKGKGKKNPLKALMKYPKYHEAFQKLGEQWEVEPNVMKDLEVFICAMYGYPQESSVNVVRAKILKKMVGEDETLTTKSKVDLS